ncbi:hypothetical protein LWC33_09010 [Pseudonocardia sp. RS11V-5]|uniref:hypothetical protein n=1 Tax=Pseudonocardia terrae TaxID=2905831 RepID=UPI001E4FF3BB|nr:hypothetical protein [Pseudonocardia terrae]MCE3551592.1 hypothetical protein [Pseudonocardia terrae]
MSTLISIRPGRTFPAPEHRHTWSSDSHHLVSGGPVSYRTCLFCGAWGVFAPTASVEDGC